MLLKFTWCTSHYYVHTFRDSFKIHNICHWELTKRRSGAQLMRIALAYRSLCSRRSVIDALTPCIHSCTCAMSSIWYIRSLSFASKLLTLCLTCSRIVNHPGCLWFLLANQFHGGRSSDLRHGLEGTKVTIDQNKTKRVDAVGIEPTTFHMCEDAKRKSYPLKMLLVRSP